MEDIEIMNSVFSINGKSNVIYLNGIDYDNKIVCAVWDIYKTDISLYVKENFDCEIVENSYNSVDHRCREIKIVNGLYICFNNREEMNKCYEHLISLGVMNEINLEYDDNNYDPFF